GHVNSDRRGATALTPTRGRRQDSDRRGATALTPTRGRRQDSDRRGATALTPTRGRRHDSDRRGATALTPTRGRRQVCRRLTEASARTSCGSSFVWRSSTVQAKGMLLIAAPGQGAQTPGFLREWLELPDFAERLGPWSELAGCDLIRYGTTTDADEIRDTAVA